MATASLRVPARDRRHQILAVATELFARLGYDGATTRLIAQRARVNEAIIFRHFPTKEDLYWAVIEHQCQLGGGSRKLHATLAGPGSDRAILIALAEEIFARDTTLLRLLLFTALENHGLSQRFFRSHVAPYYEQLAAFVRKGIAAGRYADVDPILATRALLGMIFYHRQVQELFGGKHHREFDSRQVSETLVDIWLGGMEKMRDPDAGSFVLSRSSNRSHSSGNGRGRSKALVTVAAGRQES